MSYSVEDIEKMKEMAAALENFVRIIQQQFIEADVENHRFIGFQKSAAKKIYEAMDFYVSLSHPPSNWFGDILQSPFHDILEVAKEIQKRYFDIIKDTSELSRIDDPQRQFEQIASLDCKSKELAKFLRSRAQDAEKESAEQKMKEAEKPAKTSGGETAPVKEPPLAVLKNPMTCAEIGGIIHKRSDNIAQTLKRSKYPVVKSNRRYYCNAEDAGILWPKWKKHWQNKQSQ